MSSAPPREAIAIVGSGRVARALGKALTACGARVVAVASRDMAHAEAAASLIEGARAVAVDRVPWLATRIIVAVTDGQIAGVAATLAQPQVRDAIVVHTSGAAGLVSLQSLRDAGASCGVMHPLQTIGDSSQAPGVFDGIPFAVLGDAPAVEWATAVAASLGAWPLHPRELHLASYHAAAVMAGNSMWAVIDAAVLLMMDAGISAPEARAAIGPLARTSLEHALAPRASDTLTGPVARADLETLRRHLAVLEGAPPHLRDLYHAVSQYLAEMAAKSRLTPDETAALRALLAASK